jgi:two-component system, sensor histidine kinase and response regulator
MKIFVVLCFKKTKNVRVTFLHFLVFSVFLCTVIPKTTTGNKLLFSQGHDLLYADLTSVENFPEASYADPEAQMRYYTDQTWKLRNSMPEKSLEFGLKAIVLADSLNDYYHLVKAHSFTGVAHRLLGNYGNAMDYYFKGLELAKKYKIPQQEGYAYINIANLHIYLEFYSQALENLNLAMDIARRIDDKDMLSYILLNKGRVLMNINSAELAVSEINAALALRKETGNVPGQAVCYKYLGDIFFNKNDFARAQENYDLAFATVDRDTDRDLMGNLLVQTARIFCRTGKFMLAYPYAQEALSIGKEVSSRLLIHDAMRVLVNVYQNKKDHEHVAWYLSQMNLYADSLFNQQLSEKVLGMEFQLERQKKAAEAEIQSLKFSRQRYINVGLIVFSVLLVITGAILLVLLRKLNAQNLLLSKQKIELKQLNADKDRMFMVIGHDLRSPVWNLRAMIELLRDDQVAIKDNLWTLSRAVQSVSDLLENLLFWARSQDGKIVYKPGPTDLKYLIMKSMQPYKTWAEIKNLNIELNVQEDASMVNSDENMIQTVIRNLVSNAVKYSNNDGRIEITVKRNGSHSQIRVTDFGGGIKPDQLRNIMNNSVLTSSNGTVNEPGSGIGLSLCKDFILRHNSKLMVESAVETGTSFYFDLPVLQRAW